MVARALQLLGLCWLSALLSGCVEEPSSVRLDLCPGPDASAEELALMQGVASWNVELLGLENEDVTWRRVWAGSDALDQLYIEGAIPQDHQVRILVEGFGLDGTGDHRVIALGTSGILILQGDERICMCVAPPERYVELCDVWSCVFNLETGACESPR